MWSDILTGPDLLMYASHSFVPIVPEQQQRDCPNNLRVKVAIMKSRKKKMTLIQYNDMNMGMN